MLDTGFENLDRDAAMRDLENFIDADRMDVWGPEAYKALARRIRIENG